MADTIMKQTTTTTPQPTTSGGSLKDLIDATKGIIGAPISSTKTKVDPLNKTAAESNYVQIGGRTVKRNPIGVDASYVAPFKGQNLGPEAQADLAQGWDPASTGIAPRYDPSDLDLFAGLSPEATSQIQSSLLRAGLIPQAALGLWDETSATAMSRVLAYANKRGLLWSDALDEYAAHGDAAGVNAGPKRAAFTPRLSNPDDLRKTFKQVAFNSTGGNFLDDGAYERMVASYQDAEMKAQRAQYDAAVSGGTTVDAPNAQTFAETQLKETNAADVQANSFAQYGKVFESMLGSAG